MTYEHISLNLSALAKNAICELDQIAAKPMKHDQAPAAESVDAPEEQTAGKDEETNEYTCPECVKEVAAEDEKCPHCGCEFSEDEEDEDEDLMQICPQCGAELSEDAEKCPHCGAEVEFLEDDRQFLCPECGKPVPEDVEQCPSCGAALMENE